jgi:hypothetical protein
MKIASETIVIAKRCGKGLKNLGFSGPNYDGTQLS